MPSSAQHREKYEANRHHLNTGNNGAPLSTLDGCWAATVAFYAALHLLDRLAARKFAGTPPEMRDELLRYFSDPDAAYATKRNPKAWAKVQEQLEQLKSAVPAPEW